MSMRSIWLRLGVRITATEEEIESLFDSDKFNETLKRLIEDGKFEVEGDSYIPEPSVEQYNETYNENHEIGEY